MSPQRLSHFKRKLEALVVELKADLERDTGATDTVALDTSIGRLSRMDAMQSQQMALELQRRQTQALTRAEHALERIEQGTYGQCRRCRKPIDEERLDVQPDTAFCVPCLSRG